MDNRLRQWAAWVLHDDVDAEPEESLAWLIASPPDSRFRAVQLKAINLPVYDREQWFLVGWREMTPTWPRLIEPLYDAGLADETISALKQGRVLRFETIPRDDLWDTVLCT